MIRREDGRLGRALGRLLCLIGASAFAYSAYRLLCVYPPPWPDEALFADVARHLSQSGQLATELYRQAIPSLTARFYITPPLYPIFLAGVVRLCGAGLVALRLTSVLLGVAVVVLTHTVARRSGQSHTIALSAVGLLLADGVFQRASHIGRMDMLAVGLVLATLVMTLGHVRWRYRGPQWAAAGCAAGLAVLTHPLGIVAPLAAGAALIARQHERGETGQECSRCTLRYLRWFTVGLTATVTPYMFYVLSDMPGFSLQLANQLRQKSDYGSASARVQCILSQWWFPSPIMALIVLAGFAGLIMAARRNGRAHPLWMAQVMIVAAIVVGGEPWYSVYAVPLTCIGLANAAAEVARPGRWSGIVGASGALAGGLFFVLNLLPVAALLAPSGDAVSTYAEYRRWCHEVENTMASGSTVLWDCIPTPVFGVSESRYRHRFLRPAGYEIGRAAERASLDELDYVVTDKVIKSSMLRRWVADHCAIVGEVAVGRYYARVYGVRRLE